MGWFGDGNIDTKFQSAYNRFMAFCNAHHKSTSIHEFSYKTFKLTPGSLLGSISKVVLFFMLFLMFVCLCMPILRCLLQQFRLRGYPRGLGKGHDAAIVGSWLDQELQQIDVQHVDTCMCVGNSFYILFLSVLKPN